jgi:hypothetical protein
MKNYSLGDDYGAIIQVIEGVDRDIKKINTTIDDGTNTKEIIITNLEAEIKKLNHNSTQIIINKFNILKNLIKNPVVNEEDDTEILEEEKIKKKDKKRAEDQAKINEFITYVSNEIDKFIIPYLQALKALKDAKEKIEKYTFDDSKTRITIKASMDVAPNNLDIKPSIQGLETNKISIESVKSEYLEEIKEVEGYKSELKKVVDLLSEYNKICDENIKKYDKIFKHNDISSIDDVFMIKSYSDFLKKLNKLKENLESKDKGKIKRAFTEFVKRLINLYGLNFNKKETFQGDNLKFLTDRIVNYV